MIKNIERPIILLLFIFICSSCSQTAEKKLFNGESLDGWEGPAAWFRVENETIIGGSLDKPVNKSYYLCTEEKYENFELTLEAKFNTSDLNINGGISFRAKRVPNSTEVMGYQADIGYADASVISNFSDYTPQDTSAIYPLWGSLVDEGRPDVSRYPKPDIFPVIFYRVAPKEVIEKLIDPIGWNEVQIRAEGQDIKIQINGVLTAQFTENTDVPSKGCICLQAHSGKPYEIAYKKLLVKQL
ncbi:MAG: DUF1080 domain-containing protein [Saprospiraceae bacterium]|nr:DUF1080 domain-containing protein [Saprospiraceae bacterium]